MWLTLEVKTQALSEASLAGMFALLPSNPAAKWSYFRHDEGFRDVHLHIGDAHIYRMRESYRELLLSEVGCGRI